MATSDDAADPGAPIDEAIDQLNAFDPQLRSAAIERLVRSGHAAVPALCRALVTAPDVARVAICQVLGTLQAPEAATALCEAVTEGSSEVRRAALAALAALPPERVAHPLRELAGSGGEAGLAAAELLAELHDFGALPILQQMLLFSGWQVHRVRVIRALGRLGDPRAFSTLCELLEGPSADEALAAIRALQDLGDPRAVEPLWLLGGPNERDSLRQARIEAMASFGSSAVPGLVGLLQNDDGKAEAALVRIGEAAIAPLIDALPHLGAAACTRAIWVLGGLKAAEAGPALAFALGDSIAAVREGAALALAEIETPCGTEQLRRIVENEAESDPVRSAAAFALARRGVEHPALEAALTRGLHLQDAESRQRAAEGLLQLANTRPNVALRLCIKRLRSLSRAWTLPEEEKRTYRTALRGIEQATRHLASLPLPAERGGGDQSSLPRPGGRPALDPERLPRPGPAATDGEATE
ncbi:MAG: HEAT repeat domain-containing protein [Armatimonadota bacterium]